MENNDLWEKLIVLMEDLWIKIKSGLCTHLLLFNTKFGTWLIHFKFTIILFNVLYILTIFFLNLWKGLIWFKLLEAYTISLALEMCKIYLYQFEEDEQKASFTKATL